MTRNESLRGSFWYWCILPHRELCQRLELRAAARRKHMPCLEPISRGEMRYRGNTKTLLKRKGTETLPLEIIAMIFRCQEEYCNDYDGDHH